jgi:hypothetical protein
MSGKDEVTGPSRTVDPSIVDSKYVVDYVENMKKNDPIGYSLAQKYGEFLMNSRMSDCDHTIEKQDLEGEQIMFKKIKRDIKNNGLLEEDMMEHEIKILIKFLGDNWKDVFNQEQ